MDTILLAAGDVVDTDPFYILKYQEKVRRSKLGSVPLNFFCFHSLSSSELFVVSGALGLDFDGKVLDPSGVEENCCRDQAVPSISGRCGE